MGRFFLEIEQVDFVDVVDSMNSSQNGTGKDQATIRGGFKVLNQQNVKFEELTISHPRGPGLWLAGSEINVDVMLTC